MSFAAPLAALAAGILSFSSPCCLPLVPSYLSYISALPVSDLPDEEARRITFRASLMFVAGFTVVFTALGASAVVIGSLLLVNLPVILRVAGVLVILMGLNMAGLLRLPFLAREYRLDLAKVGRGPRAAFPLGMAFAAGWVPCIGPVLATILTLAATTDTVAWGALLLAIYSLGLGVPFILLALGFHRFRRSVAWLRQHGRAVERVGGAFLVGVGVLFLTGAWQRFFLPLQREFARWNWPPI